MTAPDEVDGLQSVAIYRGHELPANRSATGDVVLRVDDTTRRLVRPRDVRREGTSVLGTFVDVPPEAVDRMELRRWIARWDGEKVELTGRVDPATGLVPVLYEADPSFAASHGLTGSQNDGWSGVAPFDELTDVALVVTRVI